MAYRVLALFAVLALAGCATPRVERDYDDSRDFAAYRTWSWQAPALRYRPADDPRMASDLTERRIRSAVAAQLEQRGLRAVAEGAPADLKVQAWLIVDERQKQTGTPAGYWGGGSWGGPWVSPAYSEPHTVDYQVVTLQLDLFDGRDGKLVWRASMEQTPRPSRTPAQREADIREAVAGLLAHYPPHGGH